MVTKANLCKYRNDENLKLTNDISKEIIDHIRRYLKIRYTIQCYKYDDECILALLSVFWDKPDVKHHVFQIVYRDKATRQVLKHELLNLHSSQKLEVDIDTYVHTMSHIMRTGIQTLLEIAATQESVADMDNVRSLAYQIYAETFLFFRTAYIKYTGIVRPQLGTFTSDHISLAFRMGVPISHALAELKKLPTDKAKVELAEFDFHYNCEWLPKVK